MSIQAVAWALEQDLPARPKLVLVSIANHADHVTGYCWLKAETIAGESACTKRSVYRFIGGLIRNGYIRRQSKRGDDGKQRANDYWILFERADAKWDWGAQLDSDDDPPDGDDDTTSCDPGDRISSGEEGAKDAPEPVDKHAVSSGPGDSGVTRKSLDEPSKSNPEKKTGAHSFASAPRKYQPPPLAPDPPQGALHPDATKPIFVYAGTPAYDAWCEYKSRERGVAWKLKTTITVDGQHRTGWSFPTLFPPSREPAKESAEAEKATGPPAKKPA